MAATRNTHRLPHADRLTQLTCGLQLGPVAHRASRIPGRSRRSYMDTGGSAARTNTSGSDADSVRVRGKSKPPRRLSPSGGVAHWIGVDMSKRTCEVDSCGKPYEARGFCAMHYQRARKAGLQNLEPQDDPHEVTDADPDRKVGTCRTCGPGVPLQKWGPRWMCAPEKNRRKREHYHRNRAKMNRYYSRYARAKAHGVAVGEIEELIDSIGSMCEICECPLDHASARIDHDHSCCPTATAAKPACSQCIRGVLCNRCNTGLGQFFDNPNLLRAASEYLASHRITR